MFLRPFISSMRSTFRNNGFFNQLYQMRLWCYCPVSVFVCAFRIAFVSTRHVAFVWAGAYTQYYTLLLMLLQCGDPNHRFELLREIIIFRILLVPWRTNAPYIYSVSKENYALGHHAGSCKLSIQLDSRFCDLSTACLQRV